MNIGNITDDTIMDAILNIADQEFPWNKKSITKCYLQAVQR
jgi:hypothetical protein